MAEDTHYTSILTSVPEEKFQQILKASARKARESYFARYGIKAPKGAGFGKPGAKNEARTRALYQKLTESEDHELAEEILRVYLLTHRDMLAAALDHLGIEHQDGLTDSDEVSKFESLRGEGLSELFRVLAEITSPDDAQLYLKYMGADAKLVNCCSSPA